MSDREEKEICPYCPDGVLEDIEGYEMIKACSNEGSCPATFVAVIG